MYGLEVLGKKFKTTMPMEFCIKIANCKHLKKAISKINRAIKLLQQEFLEMVFLLQPSSDGASFYKFTYY